MLVGPGGIALTCTIQHLGRLQVTSLGLMDRSGEPIPDVARIREHRWLLAEQVAMAHRSYVPVAPILIATPFTRISILEPPIGSPSPRHGGCRGHSAPFPSCWHPPKQPSWRPSSG
jgi:hypothetical protein